MPCLRVATTSSEARDLFLDERGDLERERKGEKEFFFFVEKSSRCPLGRASGPKQKTVSTPPLFRFSLPLSFSLKKRPFVPVGCSLADLRRAEGGLEGQKQRRRWEQRHFWSQFENSKEVRVFFLSHKTRALERDSTAPSSSRRALSARKLEPKRCARRSRGSPLPAWEPPRRRVAGLGLPPLRRRRLIRRSPTRLDLVASSRRPRPPPPRRPATAATTTTTPPRAPCPPPSSCTTSSPAPRPGPSAF